MKLRSKLAVILSLSMLFTACSPAASTGSKAQESGSKISVVTSFNPIDKLVKYIGGDKVETTVFVKAGVEPHDFEPTPKDMEKLTSAKALFLNGFDMEHWSESLKLSDGTKKVELSEGIDPIKAQNENDPHIWLGLNELKIMAKNTAKALSEISPDNKAYFEENLKKFEAEADALASEYKSKFEPHKGKAFVTGHEAFAYLCRNIGLTQSAVEGPFGEGEPTPQKIAELVEYVKANKITTIFTEEAASPKVSETLAKETGTKLVEIPTMESEGDIFPTIKEVYDKVLESLK